MINDYPKSLTGKTFRIKHWKNLSFASKEGIYDIAEENLNDVIDWTNCSIKSAEELTPEDFEYLVIQHYIFSKGDSLKLSYHCSKCDKQNPLEIKLVKDAKESYLQKRINRTEDIKLDGVKIFTVRIPLRKHQKEFFARMLEYKNAGHENVDEILDILKYFPYIESEGKYNTVEEFIVWFDELDSRILKPLEEFRLKITHSLDCNKKVKCSCGHEEELEVPLSLDFFI
jgi:thiol-disulfide isomerase/thioredoxin